MQRRMLSTLSMIQHAFKVGEEGNNAIVNIALKLLILMPPFPFIPTVHGHSLYPSHPNLPRVLSMWRKNLKQSLFLSSAVALNGNCQCTGTQCPALLLPKMPVSYAMTLQKSNLALVDEGHGMRLLAYHPLSSYSRQQRCPLCQDLVSDALTSNQKLAPHCILQQQIQIQSKRP